MGFLYKLIYINKYCPLLFTVKKLKENYIVPWQISTFCFTYKCKHDANTNYGTNTNKKTRPRILTLDRVFKCAAAYFTKAICISFKITIKWKMKHAVACFSANTRPRVLNWVKAISNCWNESLRVRQKFALA